MKNINEIIDVFRVECRCVYNGGSDDEGFNCELLYSPEGVDDIAEAIFISIDNKNDLPQTIKYFISCVTKERE